MCTVFPHIRPAILVIPVIQIILCSENVAFFNKTCIWRLCEILIPVGLIWGNTVFRMKQINYQLLNQLGTIIKHGFHFFSLKEGPKCNVSLRGQLEPDLPNPKQPTSPCPSPFYGHESLKSPLSPPYGSISTSVAITLFLPKQWTHLTRSGPYRNESQFYHTGPDTIKFRRGYQDWRWARNCLCSVWWQVVGKTLWTIHMWR